MRLNEIAAEVRPYVDLDKIASQIRKLNVASQDDERLIETATKRNEERRKKMGKLLIDARAGFNDRGDGFKRYVEDQGLPYTTAIGYMREAGYVSAKSKNKNQDENRTDCNTASSPPAVAIAEEVHECVPNNPADEHPEHEQETALAVSVATTPAPMIVNGFDADVLEKITDGVESMKRNAKALQSSCTRLLDLCRQANASISGVEVGFIRAAVLSASASIEKVLSVIGGN